MRYIQPQSGPLQIDWSNPITKGLIFCVPGIGGNYDDIAGGRKATVTGVGRRASKDGVFAYFNGASKIDYPVFGPELPYTGPATIAFIDQAIAPSGYGTTLSFLPFGGSQEFLIYQGPSPYGFVAGSRGTSVPEFTGTVGVPTDGVQRRMMVRSATLNVPAVTALDVFVGNQKYTTATASALSAGGTSINRWGTLAGADYWEGIIGQKCIWNRVLSDAEALSYQANPWQIFKSPQRVMLAAVGGGPNVTVAISGQSATATGGTVSPSAAAPVAGSSATAAQGSVSVGSDVTVALAGQAVTASHGTVAPNAARAITGQATTSAQGSASPAAAKALSGQASSAQQGLLTPARAIAITGQTGTTSRGSVGPGTTAALAGLSNTAQRGTVSASGNVVVALSGQATAVAQGSMAAFAASAAKFNQSTIMRATVTNRSVPARETSISASSTMRSSFSQSTIMRINPLNATATMSDAAINRTANLL